MLELYYTRVQHTPLPTELWQTYFSNLPQNLQQKINRLRRWQDQHASLFGKLLLQQALCQAGYGADCLNQLQYSKYNRPFIDNTIDFNISHSGKYIVCALSHQGQLGIDIELIKPIEISNFQNYMTSEQWLSITTSPISQEKFYEFWTIKESVIKADGRGLSIPLQDIHIKGHKAFIYDDIRDTSVWFITKLDIDPNYVSHLVTNWENPKIHLKKIEFY